MPYIDQEARNRLAAGGRPQTVGELNYAISRLMTEYVEVKGLSYSSCAEARIAALDAAEEFYRRVVTSYENAKKIANGDVYGELPREALEALDGVIIEHLASKS